MRPRKRPDWPIRVYKYSVRPEYRTWERLPAGARQEIEEVRALWNSMVEVFGRRQTRYREIVSQPDRDAVGQQVPATRYAVDQLHRAFVAEVQHLAADAPVMRGHRQVVLFQFLATVTRFLRNKGGVPKPKHGVPTEVHFHQRFDGGIPVERIFGRSQRFHLERVPSAALDPLLPFRQQKRLARIGGTLHVRDSVLPFQTMLHRQLPTGAYLKQASLIGRQIVRAGYHPHGRAPSVPSSRREIKMSVGELSYCTSGCGVKASYRSACSWTRTDVRRPSSFPRTHLRRGAISVFSRVKPTRNAKRSRPSSEMRDAPFRVRKRSNASSPESEPLALRDSGGSS